MMHDAYSQKDNAARCAQCNRFMPWERSRQVQESDGMPEPSPVLVETGICARCEAAKERVDG